MAFNLELAGKLVGQITTTQITPGAITTPLLAAGSVTAAIIAAGTVKAGIVDGTTITGATLVADGSTGGVLVYTGTPASGNLLVSISGAVTTDGLGNAIKPGINVRPTSGPTISYVSLAFVNGFPSIQLFTGQTQESTPGAAWAQVINSGASQQYQLVVSSAVNALSGHHDSALVLLNSAADDGSQFALGQLAYMPNGGSPGAVLTWGHNGLKVFDGYGDATAYNTERQTLILAAAVTINTTAQTQILATIAAGANGQYVIEGQFVVVPNAAGGTASFELSGGGGVVVASSAMTWEAFTLAAPQANLSAQYSDPGYQAVYTTPTLTTTAFVVRFRAEISITTAGTLALFATEAGGGTYSIKPRATYAHVYPVGP